METFTASAGFTCASGRTITPLINATIVELVKIANVSVRTARSVKTGDLASCLKANLKSWIMGGGGSCLHSDELQGVFGFRILRGFASDVAWSVVRAI